MTAGDERLLFDGVAEPTLASTWLRLTEHPIDDDLLQWPPDVFALTDVLLEHAEGFRFALSPPAGAVWPPDRFADWGEAVGEAAQQWSRLAEDRDDPLPELVVEEWSVIRDASATPLERVADGGHWRLCEALLTLHAVADEACAGLFVRAGPLGRAGVQVPSSWSRGVSENGVAGPNSPPAAAGAAQDPNAPDWEGVVLTLRLRPWPRVRDPLAQAAGPPSRDRPASRARRDAAVAMAAEG